MTDSTRPIVPAWTRREALRFMGLGSVAVVLAGCSDGGSGGDSTTTTEATGSTTTTAAVALTDADWASLSGDLSGSLVRPGDASFATDRLLFNPLFDAINPQGIARCASSDDVATSLAFARQHGLEFSVRSGGHSFGGYSTCPGLVIDVRPMGDTTVGDDGTATVGAGAHLIDVYAALAAAGRMVPGGSCPTVGVAGLTLGGGVGVVGRKYGLTIDNLRSMDVVLADGRTVTCDATTEPDLFWALRGVGGGNFGIVTSFEFDTHEAPALALGGVTWPWSAASKVLAAWMDWAPTAPDELWSNALLLADDSAGTSGDPTVRIGAVFVGSTADLKGQLDDLIAAVGVDPTSQYLKGEDDYLAAMQFEGGCSKLSLEACRLPSEDPAGQLQREASVARSEYVSTALPAAAADLIVSAVEAMQASSTLGGGGAAFDSYGGAIGRVAADATAFVHRSPLCSLLINATMANDATQAVIEASETWVDDLGSALQPYVDGEAYQNYIDPRRSDWASAYYGKNLDRLKDVKATYDPDDVFTFAQSIPLP